MNERDKNRGVLWKLNGRYPRTEREAGWHRGDWDREDPCLAAIIAWAVVGAFVLWAFFVTVLA